MNRKQARSRWAEILGHDAEITGHVGPKYPHWFNNIRLLEPIGHIPPAEKEAKYWSTQAIKRASVEAITLTT